VIAVFDKKTGQWHIDPEAQKRIEGIAQAYLSSKLG
jgi:hypothetical protein